MEPELVQSLIITGIGMGLVLAALLLLWGLMWLLVRLTRERAPQRGDPTPEQRPAPPTHVVEQRRQAAVAAVAVAMARARQTRRPRPAGSGAAPSPWQAAHRQAQTAGRRTVE